MNFSICYATAEHEVDANQYAYSYLVEQGMEPKLKWVQAIGMSLISMTPSLIIHAMRKKKINHIKEKMILSFIYDCGVCFYYHNKLKSIMKGGRI